MLSPAQIKNISAIAADLGQVCIASAVVPFVVPQFAPEAVTTIISGLLFAVIFWILSIVFVKNL